MTTRPVTFTPRTPEEAVDAIRPFLRNAMQLVNMHVDRLYVSCMRDRAAIDPSWSTMQGIIERRVAEGFREHGGDLWTPSVGPLVYLGEAQEEVADAIAYHAMLLWNETMRAEWE